MRKMAWSLRGKSVLVTGGTGTIGEGLVRRLARSGSASVVVFSRDETKQFFLQQEFPRVRFVLGDVRDPERLEQAMEGVDVVYHAAALKHVPACDRNPEEAVRTNVLGTRNVLNAARETGVERVVAISTDKAVYPTSTLGATKMLMEKMVTGFSSGGLRAACVRFGNVLGSRGSVIPLFLKQMSQGFVTLTDPSMTRFFMRTEEAVELVIQASLSTRGGEIFVLKMRPVRMKDLAEALISVAAPRLGRDAEEIEVRLIGPRPGERNHEWLMTEEEGARCLETRTMFIIPGVDGKRASYPGARRTGVAGLSSARGPFLAGKPLRALLEKLEVWRWAHESPP